MKTISLSELNEALIEHARNELLRHIKIHLDNPMKKKSNKKEPMHKMQGGMMMKDSEMKKMMGKEMKVKKSKVKKK